VGKIESDAKVMPSGKIVTDPSAEGDLVVKFHWRAGKSIVLSERGPYINIRQEFRIDRARAHRQKHRQSASAKQSYLSHVFVLFDCSAVYYAIIGTFFKLPFREKGSNRSSQAHASSLIFPPESRTLVSP
jgi:hypothetical protein